MTKAKRIDSYNPEVMVGIIFYVLQSELPDQFKKHILLKELLWKHDSPRGVKGDNSVIKFSKAAEKKWKKNESEGRRPNDGLVTEHTIPRIVIYEHLVSQKRITKKFISNVLQTMVVRVKVTKEEDNELNKMKLGRAMPIDWDGIDPFARHKKAKIKLSSWLPDKYKKSPVQ